MKKNPISLHIDPDEFAPATSEEKESLVIMRESVSFWKDGFRRLFRNKIAVVSLAVIILIVIFAYFLPAFWPYSYEQQIQGSENLAPFKYSTAEQARIDGYDGHICGHIHFGCMREEGDVVYLNDGDWVEHCTALVEHADGGFELLHWTGRRLSLARAEAIATPAVLPAAA